MDCFSPTTQMMSPALNLREMLIIVRACCPASMPTSMQL